MTLSMETQLVEQVRDAFERKQPLAITGGNSKSFYGREIQGETLHLSGLSGIERYDPTELVITVNAGTTLIELQNALAQEGQMLGFEPPVYTEHATIGGAVASGLAGCGRASRGGVRDYVLGIKLMTGSGEIMQFGGQVMKNVAGFDHSRLMAGALGTLGIILQVSLRVIPLPQYETTLCFQHENPSQALGLFAGLRQKPYPLTAACWHQSVSRIRLSGSEAGVKAAVSALAIETELTESSDTTFWQNLTNQKLDWFCDARRLVRVSVAPNDPLPASSAIDSSALVIEWGGAQRWLCQDMSQDLKNSVEQAGGHVSDFRGGNRQADVFAVPVKTIMGLQKNLKAAFDPAGILNPGRLFRDL